MSTASHDNPTQALISSLEKVYELKSIPRTGWLQNGISELEVESIAAHSYGMSILIMYLTPTLRKNGISVERALNMALVHDIAEAIVGDLTPQDNVALDDKHAAEASAFREIVSQVEQGDYFTEIWEEFEAAETPEAKLVKRIDKLDMLIQAYLYEKKFLIRLDTFWENMDTFFKDSESETIYKYMQARRFEVKGIQE